MDDVTIQQPFGGPGSDASQPIPPKPDNYLVWAILCTLCCCIPFGIVSIVYAAKVNSLYTIGQYAAAEEASNNAKKWAIIGAISGLVIQVIYWLLVFGGVLSLGALGMSGSY